MTISPESAEKRDYQEIDRHQEELVKVQSKVKMIFDAYEKRIKSLSQTVEDL